MEYMRVESTQDGVKSEARWCLDTLVNMLDAATKKRRVCSCSKRWWIGRIKERRCQLGSEKRARHKYAATAPATGELLNSFWRVKDRMWNDYPKN